MSCILNDFKILSSVCVQTRVNLHFLQKKMYNPKTPEGDFSSTLFVFKWKQQPLAENRVSIPYTKNNQKK